MASSWTLSCGTAGITASLREFPGVDSAAAALDVIEHVKRAAGGDFLVRVREPHDATRFLDVAVCEWGWALLWNDYESTVGESFGTLGGGESEARSFTPPAGDDLEFDRTWFVGESEGRRAVEVYVRTRKLWAGVRWWPAPPADLLAE